MSSDLYLANHPSRFWRLQLSPEPSAEDWEEAARDHPWGDGHRPRILAEVAKARERAGDLAGAHAAAEEALSAATALHARGTPHPPHLMDGLMRKVSRLGRLL